jgi:PAS domain S-box-containing protein
MKSEATLQPPILSGRPFARWLQWSSSLAFLTSVGLLFASLFAYSLQSTLAVRLIPLLLIELGFAIFLNIYSFLKLRKEHQNADQAFRDAACESLSIFQRVLDGILIVNNEGECLDANPAATNILRVSINNLIGRNITVFAPGCPDFRQTWSSFIQSSNNRHTLELIAGNGATFFAEVAVTTDYVPGRHVLILCDVTERTRSEMALKESEQRFRHMADNIQEIFWMMDADTQEALYVNPAYSSMTGYSIESLQENPSSYRDLIHPEDRIRIVSRLQDLAQTGILDEEFRFIHASGETRWAWAKGTLAVGKRGKRWLVGTAQDVTSRKRAEIKITEQLDLVDAARAEAEALRKATLALSRNLAMDSVLDTLMQCIFDLIPYDRATVLFLEGDNELMVAREAPRSVPKRIGLTFSSSSSIFVQRILYEKHGVLLSATSEHSGWQDIQPFERLQSWLGIPLVAGGQVLGILSLGAHKLNTFTTEHLRVAKSLAIPATVAIQNARAHERAEIYAAELELRLHELREAQNALQQVSRKQ